jgi:potassium/hydrogen antiporter
MEIITLFTIAGIIILIGFLAEYIFQKTRIPDVLWLMIIGLILGYFFNIAENDIFLAIAPVFTTFALVFILFEGVLSIDLKELFSGVAKGSNLSFISFILTMIFTGIVMMAAGWGFLEGMLLGAMLGDSAQTVIIPLLRKIRIKHQTAISLTFESAISDVLCIIGSITILNIILIQSFSVSMIVQSVTYSLLMAIIAGLVFGILWVKMHPAMDRLSKSYITTIAALLMLYSLVEYLEASGALACLVFGIIVGNSRKIFRFLKKDAEYNMDSSAKFFYSEVTFFLKTFFFVYLGLMINLGELHLILIGAFLAVALFFLRALAVKISFRKVHLELKDRTALEILNPKGLAAAILAQLPAQYGLPHGQEFSTVVLSVIVFSILITILTVFLAERGMYSGAGDLLTRLRKIFLRAAK